jgi:glycosyltransferase involved in cell wall biosynthesis
MQVTRTSPIQFNIKPISGSTLSLKFLVKGSKETIKIDTRIVIHFKNSIHRNMVDMVSSDILSVLTHREDRIYKTLTKVPEFKNYTQSYIIFAVNQNEGLQKKAFIEDINIGFLSQKIDNPIVEEISLSKPKGFTTSEMIDQMTQQYDRNLPKDSKKRVTYIYSLYSNDSFHIVASNHIKYLKQCYVTDNEHVEIEETDWSQLSNINWDEKRSILLHPFLYPFASSESFAQNSRNFARLLSMKNKIGGFDVADSSRISRLAVDLVNKIDLMIVPSNFSKNAYINSGVTIPIEVLPHGISDNFLRDDRADIDNIKTENINILGLKRAKKYGNVLVLYFLVHSEYRKGADIVAEVMKRIQKKYPNVLLVVKSGHDTKRTFDNVNHIGITGWLDDKELKTLYDCCDMCISPSRGGGFELNALEAASRGIPTLVTNGGCFTDLINYFIPISLNSKVVQPLPGNAVHIGYGYEVDINDLEAKIIDTISRLEYWENRFKNNSEEIREKYSWRNVSRILDGYLKNYGFIE